VPEQTTGTEAHEQAKKRLIQAISNVLQRRTFNPKVASSSLARPIAKSLLSRTFPRVEQVRLLCEGTSGVQSWASDREDALHLGRLELA
jgi:hypothetical protein